MWMWPDTRLGAAGFVTWFSETRRVNRLAVLLVLGALAALGQAPVGLWPATILALALLYAFYRCASGPGQAARWGWIAGTGYFMLALSWIVEPFLVDVARHGWIAPFALIGLASGLALFWAGAFAVARGLGGGAVAWIGAFVLAEAMRTYVLTGFPWAQIGHVWIETPMLQWASLTGSLGLSAAMMGAGAAVWHLIGGRRWAGAAGTGILAVLYATGGLIVPASDAPDDAPLVRLVQPNAPQHEKWDPDKLGIFFDRQIAFTAAEGRPDLIVWPETAVPVLLNDPGATFEFIADAAGGVPVVVGAQRRDGARLFNALAVIGEQGQVTAQYDKFHLVPFGEYVPYGDTLGQFGISGMAASDGNGYSAGPGAQVLTLKGLGKALPLICYEGVFPQDVRAAPERADFMLLITNDAWFGDISGPYQHLAQARLRSVEQGLPMIRVANTGVSAMIDARGEITAHIPLGQEGWIDAVLPPPLPPTVYARTGDWPVLAALGLLLGLSRLLGGTVRSRFND